MMNTVQVLAVNDISLICGKNEKYLYIPPFNFGDKIGSKITSLYIDIMKNQVIYMFIKTNQLS